MYRESDTVGEKSRNHPPIRHEKITEVGYIALRERFAKASCAVGQGARPIAAGAQAGPAAPFAPRENTAAAAAPCCTPDSAVRNLASSPARPCRRVSPSLAAAGGAAGVYLYGPRVPEQIGGPDVFAAWDTAEWRRYVSGDASAHSVWDILTAPPPHYLPENLVKLTFWRCSERGARVRKARAPAPTHEQPPHRPLDQPINYRGCHGPALIARNPKQTLRRLPPKSKAFSTGWREHGGFWGNWRVGSHRLDERLWRIAVLHRCYTPQRASQPSTPRWSDWLKLKLKSRLFKIRPVSILASINGNLWRVETGLISQFWLVMHAKAPGAQL